MQRATTDTGVRATTNDSEAEGEGFPRLNQDGPLRRLLTTIRRPWLLRQYNRQQREGAAREDLPQAQFEELIRTAEDIAKINPRGVFDLIKAVLRPLQSERLLAIALRGSVADRIDSYWFFGDAVRARLFTPDGMNFRGARLDANDHILNLASDTILPTPWSRLRYIDAMATIGSAKGYDKIDRFPDSDFSWRQDCNHRVELWMPWRIGFVASGNHSIAAGILAGEGSVVPDDVYDMSFLLDELSCDSRVFSSPGTKKIISPTPDARIGAVFEMGRLVRGLL